MNKIKNNLKTLEKMYRQLKYLLENFKIFKKLFRKIKA